MNYNVKHPLIPTTFVFKPYNFVEIMKKRLLYSLLFATIFVATLHAFSLTIFHKKVSQNFENSLVFSKHFSKKVMPLINIDIVSDCSSDDEENLTSNDTICGSLECFYLNKIKCIAVVYPCNMPQSLNYFFKNLSRIPRFNFLNLNVLRI